MRLFIDTNSLLAYFKVDADTKALEEVVRLQREKRLRVIYTAQSESEFARNIGDIIAAARNGTKGATFQLAHKPNIEDTEARKTIDTKVAEANKAYEASRARRLIAFEKKIQATEKLIEAIFNAGEKIEYSADLIERAKLRHIKGDPPRKEGSDSHGDAINWESLLEMAGDDDLSLITRDQDYTEGSASGLILNRVLKKEWAAKSKKSLTHHTSLGDFVNSFESKRVVAPETVKRESTSVPDYFVRPIFIDERGILNVATNVSNAVSSINTVQLADSVIGNTAYLTRLGSVISDATDTYGKLTLAANSTIEAFNKMQAATGVIQTLSTPLVIAGTELSPPGIVSNVLSVNTAPEEKKSPGSKSVDGQDSKT